MNKNLKLDNFNNISKSIFASFYRFSYTLPQKKFIEGSLRQLNNLYSSRQLSSVIHDICQQIGACLLSSSKKDYKPMGASAVALLAEFEEEKSDKKSDNAFAGNHSTKTDEFLGYLELCHLDKSHIALHTYPEANPKNGVCTFRIDLEVSTCGIVSPMTSFLYCMNFINPDLAFMDYKQRGFTRNKQTGQRLYVDNPLKTIKNVLNDDLLAQFELNEVALPLHRLHMASLKRKNIVDHRDKNCYFYKKNLLDSQQIIQGLSLISKEIDAICEKK